MTETTTPRLRKWVFFLGDALLLALAWWIMKSGGNPIGFAQALICFLAVAVGAWFAILPFLKEYQAELKLTESTRLNNATAALKNLEKVAGQITSATSDMGSLRELCHETVESTRSIAEGVSQEARRFSETMLKANDQEKHNLRLELDKVRRAEGDWVQVLTRILDHTYALHQAGIRSGQRPLMTQLTHFQNACRDAARRVGLVPIEANEGENFDPARHQLPQEDADPGKDPRVLGTLATGYSYQGNLLRPVLVQLIESAAPSPATAVAEEPVAEEPVAEEPITEEPTAEEPVTEEPIAEEPIAEEPIAEEPIAEEPIAEEPIAEEPVTEEPIAEEPIAEEPIAEEPIAEEPIAEEPIAEEPIAEESVSEQTADEDQEDEEQNQDEKPKSPQYREQDLL